MAPLPPLPPLPLPWIFLRFGITVSYLPLKRLSFKCFAYKAASFVSNSTYADLLYNINTQTLYNNDTLLVIDSFYHRG